MKIKKRVSFLTFAALVFLTFCLPFFWGCGAKKNAKYRYELDLTLKENVLEGVLDYSEGLGAQSDGKLCFCLLPNYLFECERLKNSEIEGFYGESLAGENLAERPLKITETNSRYEFLQNGAYMLITPEVKGETRQVKISFTVQIPSVQNSSGGGRLACTADGVNLACFYPYRCVYDNGWFTPPAASEGDPFYGDFADYGINLSVPSAYVVAGGTPRSLDINGGVAEYNYEFKNRRSVAFCLSENFNVISKKWGNRSINCYFVNNFNQNESANNAGDLNGANNKTTENADLGYAYYEKLTALAADCLNYFCEIFGEYPYGDYSLAFTPFYCGGMEYPALSVINKNQSVQNTVKAVVHETAHQWFPLLVSNNEYTEAYFDEGLAEFAAFRYFSAKKSDLAEEMLDCARKTVINYANNVSEKMKMNKNLNEFNGEYDYYACVYARGLLAFCEVQKICGESKLNAAIKKFVAQNSFKRAGAAEFLNALSHKAAKNAFLSIVEGKALLCLPK